MLMENSVLDANTREGKMEGEGTTTDTNQRQVQVQGREGQRSNINQDKDKAETVEVSEKNASLDTTSETISQSSICTEVGSKNCENHSSISEPVKLSKNEIKRRQKQEKWIATKHERRAAEKKKKKQRLAERKQAGEEIGPSRKRLKTNTMRNSSCKIRVAIDLSLDSYMTDRDVTSLLQQVRHCYSANRRAQNPMQLYFSGLNGTTKDRLDKIGDYQNWDIYRETKNHEEAFPKDSLVYLTSESPNVLETLSEDKVYVIGGLVDHNKHKGLCYKLAEEKGIGHAQLPISEFIAMASRKVLAVNHVYSILVKYTECKDWKQAFLSEIPQRKQPLEKEQSESPQQISDEVQDSVDNSTGLARLENDDNASDVKSDLNSNVSSNCSVEDIDPDLKADDEMEVAASKPSSIDHGSSNEVSSTNEATKR